MFRFRTFVNSLSRSSFCKGWLHKPSFFVCGIIRKEIISTMDEIIPYLHFTKAELAYFITVLIPNVSITDDFTQFDLVEVRHYLNLVKDKIAMSISDGTLKKALSGSVETKDNTDKPIVQEEEPKKDTFPSIEELRQKFPSLSEEEIREVVWKVKSDKEKRELENILSKTTEPEPPKPSFLAKKRESNSFTTNETTIQNRENSRRFASMLGEV